MSNHDKDFKRQVIRDIRFILSEIKCLKQSMCLGSDINQNNKVREIILPGIYDDYAQIDTYLGTYHLVVEEDENVLFTATIKHTVDQNKTESRFWTLGKGDFNPVSVHWIEMPFNYFDIPNDAGLQLGETEFTAYRGDRGKVAYDHTFDFSNPHNVTKSQVGLSNVDNTADINKPISFAQQAALDLKADLVNGIIPANQLPSFVDDILEGEYIDPVTFNDPFGFDYIPENGKLYVDTVSNLVYRWSGSAYVTTSSSLALGETSTTAYRGDRGKIAYDHTFLTNNPHNVTKTQIGLSNVDNTSDLNKPVSTLVDLQYQRKLAVYDTIIHGTRFGAVVFDTIGGFGITISSGPTSRSFSNTSPFHRTSRLGFTNVASGRQISGMYNRQSQIDMIVKFGAADSASTAGIRYWIGIGRANYITGSNDPSTFLDYMGFVRTDTQTNWHIAHNDNAGTQTLIDTGFAANTDSDQMMLGRIISHPTNGIVFTLQRLSDGTIFTHTATTNLPVLTQALGITLGTNPASSGITTNAMDVVGFNILLTHYL